MGYPDDRLTIASFSEQNARRCRAAFHEVGEWNPLEWAGAMAGEAGEAANVCKKLRRRGRDAIPTVAELMEVGHEVADAVTYGDLLLASLGLSLDQVLVAKFNLVSERVGYIKPGVHNAGRMYVRY